MNMSAYELSFFQTLVLCRSLKFSLSTRKVSPMDVMATFEKEYGNIDPS